MSIVPYDIAPIGAPAANLPRLLLVLTEFPPGFGDMQTHAVNLTKHLAARGYAVEIATHRVADPALKDAEIGRAHV